MGGIASLLAQAAPAEDQAARDRRIQELLAQVQQNQQNDPTLMPQAGAPPQAEKMPLVGPTPPPVAAPAPSGGIGQWLMSLIDKFSRTAPATPAPMPTPGGITAEQLAQEKERQRQMLGQ